MTLPQTPSEEQKPAPTRNEIVCASYLSGASLRAVGADHNISHERVRQLLTKAGVPLRSRGQPRAARA